MAGDTISSRGLGQGQGGAATPPRWGAACLAAARGRLTGVGKWTVTLATIGAGLLASLVLKLNIYIGQAQNGISANPPGYLCCGPGHQH